MAKRKAKTAGGKKAAGKRTRAARAGKKRAPAKKRQAARSATAKKTKSAGPKRVKKTAAKKAKSKTSKKAKTKTAKKAKRAVAARSGRPSGKKAKSARPKQVKKTAAKKAKTRTSKKTKTGKKAKKARKTADLQPIRSTAKSASATRSAKERRPGSASGSPPSTLPELPTDDDRPRPLPKTRLSAEQLDAFRDLLLTKRAELVGDVDHLTNEALHRSRSEAAGDLSSMPIHMADIGSDNWEQEFTLGLIDNERALLVQIDEALERIAAGTYGVCLGTRKPISITRLRAKPWAKYCIEYARLRDQGRVPR